MAQGEPAKTPEEEATTAAAHPPPTHTLSAAAILSRSPPPPPAADAAAALRLLREGGAGRGGARMWEAPPPPPSVTAARAPALASCAPLRVNASSHCRSEGAERAAGPAAAPNVRARQPERGSADPATGDDAWRPPATMVRSLSAPVPTNIPGRAARVGGEGGNRSGGFRTRLLLRAFHVLRGSAPRFPPLPPPILLPRFFPLLSPLPGGGRVPRFPSAAPVLPAARRGFAPPLAALSAASRAALPPSLPSSAPLLSPGAAAVPRLVLPISGPGAVGARSPWRRASRPGAGSSVSESLGSL